MSHVAIFHPRPLFPQEVEVDTSAFLPGASKFFGICIIRILFCSADMISFQLSAKEVMKRDVDSAGHRREVRLWGLKWRCMPVVSVAGSPIVMNLVRTDQRHLGSEAMRARMEALS
jgi:hypothetical protein